MTTVGDLVAQKYGHRNWVLARRSRRIVETYGNDVICLTQKQFTQLSLKADMLIRLRPTHTSCCTYAIYPVVTHSF